MNLSDVLNALPVDDIVAAVSDPSNLGNEAKVAEDIIVAAMPGLSGAFIAVLVQLFVVWVYGSGGGTIKPDPLPMTDAQMSTGR